jgi:hypothetical protein
MQRWVTTLVGIAVVVFAVWLVARDVHAPRPLGREPDAGADAGDAGPSLALASDAGGGAPDDAEPLFLGDWTGRDLRGEAGAGAVLFDGTPVPPLPLNVPRQVRFGVALISYAGAQPSAAGGRPAARSRADARTLAERIAASARDDFHAAVQQGDPGSTDDIGSVHLGVLEPAPEYVLFTLPVAGVGGPVDTPRGYWIVKRLE